MTLSGLSLARLMVNSVSEKGQNHFGSALAAQRSQFHAVLCVMSLADGGAAKQRCFNGRAAAPSTLLDAHPGNLEVLTHWLLSELTELITEARRVISEMSLCVPWALCCKRGKNPSKPSLCSRQALGQG